MMRAAIDSAHVSEGKLAYLQDELSFDTIDRHTSGVSSILINDISIEFSEDGKAVAVWGVCPHTTWRRGSVLKPIWQKGRLWFEGELTPGVSIRVTRPGEYWPVTFDTSSGWLQIGQKSLADDQAIEFVEGCIAVLRHGELVGLCLHPHWQQ